MSKFDTKSNTSICVLPWVHEFISINDKTGPCCHSDSFKSNETLSMIRQQMLNDQKPRICSGCYKNEENTGYSVRIQETIDWIKKYGEPNIEETNLQSIDIRYDPTCNLKCKTCGPTFSTLWQKEKKVKIKTNVKNKTHFHEIDKKKLKKVYLAGGEPTYIRDYLVFLEKLYKVNPDCEVVINTNLKKLSTDWKKIIRLFKNLTVICSCDAINSLGCYVRYPLEWKEFEMNVRYASENANFLQFNLVASNLTAHKLYETCEWMKQYSNNINISIIRDPEYFTESAIPHEYRNTYLESLKKLKTFPISVHYALNFRKKIQTLIKKYSETEYNNLLHQQLLTNIKTQDGNRRLQLEKVDSFLNNWIKNLN